TKPAPPGPAPPPHARRLVTHHHGRQAPAGRSVVAVHVAAADTGGAHAHEDVALPDLRRGHVTHLETFVFAEDEGAHQESPWVFGEPGPRSRCPSPSGAGEGRTCRR